MKVFEKSLAQISLDLQNKNQNSESITKSCLDRIDRYNSEYGVFLHIDREGALLAAKESDARRQKGDSFGPLDGIPIGIKDVIVTQNMPTTAASKILEGYLSPFDATVVSRLKAQGAVIVGKLNCDEFAMGSSNENSAYALCKNPWDITKTPGGSSGGSAAAIAAGMCYATLGTDTGGSIRQPAAFCGIVGLKPSYGRVSRYGLIAFASSLDQAGPMAKDVRSAAMIYDAISGFDTSDPTSAQLNDPAIAENLSDNVSGLRIGLPREYFAEGLDPECKAAVDKVAKLLEGAGAELVEVSLPMSEYAIATYYIVASAEASSNLSRYDGIRFGPRLGDPGSIEQVYQKTRGELFGPEVKRRIMLGTYALSSGYYDAYYVRAQKVRQLIFDDFARAFEQVDVILCPTTPTCAFDLGGKSKDPLSMYLNPFIRLELLWLVCVPSRFRVLLTKINCHVEYSLLPNLLRSKL